MKEDLWKRCWIFDRVCAFWWGR